MLSRTSLACLALAAFLVAESKADSVVSMDITVKNAPAEASARVPVPGTYTLSFRAHQARIVSPSGAVEIIDFDKKLVSSLDPAKKSFYQLSLDAFLDQGLKLPAQLSNGYSLQTSVSFSLTQGQESRSILGQRAAPYDVDLEAHLNRKAGGGGGGGGIRRRRGGFPGGGFPGGGFPGAPSGSSQAGGSQTSSAGTKVAGELWLAPAIPSNGDPEQLTTAELCALMPFAPALKDLQTKIVRAKSTLLAGAFSISILDRSGQTPPNSPEVAMEVKSISPASLDASLFLIPADYTKGQVPNPPLGSVY